MKTPLKTFLIYTLMIGIICLGAVAAITLYVSAKNQTALAFEEKMLACGGVISAAADSEELKAVLKIPSDSAKKNELYLKYHRPLERIADEAELKYLYLFMYGGSKDLVYIVDAVSLADEDWCPPSSEERSEDSDLKNGLLNAFRKTGGVSEMFSDKHWGVMRSGTYPIPEKGKDRSMYMVGIDAAIGEIVAKTAWTMTKALSIFLLISALAIAIAAGVSKRISQSVAEVKDAILKIGVGEREKNGFENAPPEISEVAREIEKQAQRIDATVGEISEKRRAKSEMFELAELESALKKIKSEFAFFSPNGGDFGVNAQAFRRGENFYVWAFEKDESPVRAELENLAAIQAAIDGTFAAFFGVSDAYAAAVFDADLNPKFSRGAKISVAESGDKAGEILAEFENGLVLRGRKSK